MSSETPEETPRPEENPAEEDEAAQPEPNNEVQGDTSEASPEEPGASGAGEAVSGSGEGASAADDAEVSTGATDETPAETAVSAEAPAETPELTLGQEARAEEEEAEEERRPGVVRGKVDRFGMAMGTGRRKTAVARVRIKDGNGQLQINGRPLEEYFSTQRDRQMVEAPLQATETRHTVDVSIRVRGGGTSGQAGAIVLGMARALEAKDTSLHPKLSDGGYLTRDDRMVERKKYGFKKARKSFQFSKR